MRATPSSEIERRLLLVASDEARHLRRAVHHVPGVVGEIHPGRGCIPGKYFRLEVRFFPFTISTTVSSGIEDLVERILLAQRFRTRSSSARIALALVPRIRVDDVPLHLRAIGLSEERATRFASGNQIAGSLDPIRRSIQDESRNRGDDRHDHDDPHAVPPTASFCVGQVDLA